MKATRSFPLSKLQSQSMQNLCPGDMKYLALPSLFKKLFVTQPELQDVNQNNQRYLQEIQTLIENSSCTCCQKLSGMVRHCLISMQELLSKSNQFLSTDMKIQKLHHQLDLCQNNIFTKIMVNNIQPIVSFYSNNENKLLKRQQQQIETLKFQYQEKINFQALVNNQQLQNLTAQLRNKDRFIEEYKQIIEYLCDLNIQLKAASDGPVFGFQQTPQPL